MLKQRVHSFLGNIRFQASLRAAEMRSRLIRSQFSDGLIIYKPDGIGDFILALPAINALLENYKGKIVVVVAQQTADLVAKEFPSLNIASIPGLWTGRKGDWRKALAALEKSARQYKGWEMVSLRHALGDLDVTFFRMMQPSKSFGIVGWPLSQGGHAKEWKFTSSLRYPQKCEEFPLPLEMEAHTRAVRLAMGMPRLNLGMPSLKSFPLSNKGTIIVFPSTRSRLRNYPVDRLARSLVNAIEGRNLPIVLCGTKDEMEVLKALKEAICRTSHCQVEVMLPSTISEGAEMIASASCVIAMESAPAHIAIALGKPGVFLLGGGHYGYFAPWTTNDKQYWISRQTECRGCNWKCLYSEPYCITEITASSIAEAINSSLQ